MYDLQPQRGPMSRCAGNASFLNASMAAFCNVTDCMHGLQMDRGTGCSLHNMGHAAESHHVGHTNVYYGKQSQRFFNNELDKTYPAAPRICMNYHSTPRLVLTITGSITPFHWHTTVLTDASLDASCKECAVYPDDIWQDCALCTKQPILVQC